MRFLVCAWPDNPEKLRCPFEHDLELEGGRPTSRLPVIIDWENQKCGRGATDAEAAKRAVSAGIVPLEVMEREMVIRAMQVSHDNQTHASELLGISRDQLRYRLKKFGLAQEHDAA